MSQATATVPSLPAAICGDQSLESEVETTVSAEKAFPACREASVSKLSLWPCHVTQTAPSAAVVAAGLMSGPGALEIRISSDQRPPSR